MQAQPLVGLIVILRSPMLVDQPPRHRPAHRRLGPGLQITFALIVLKTIAGQWTFEQLGAEITPAARLRLRRVVVRVRPARRQGRVGQIMTSVLGPEGARYGVIFAFRVLPTIIFIAALFAILYYFGVMQLIVQAFALVMRRVMGASGAESLNVAASIFMGQTEAPLTIRPYLPR